MSRVWIGTRRSNYNNNSNSNSSDRRVPFKGTLEFTKAGKISGFFVDAVGTTVVRGWVDPISLSFALDARYTGSRVYPPCLFFRNEENKEMETRAAIEVNALRASESSSGFDELAEQLEDEMGCGLYCRYRGQCSTPSPLRCVLFEYFRDIQIRIFFFMDRLRRVLHAHTCKILNHQLPVFSILAQGSSGFKASLFCKSSTLIPSGDFTNAIRPSRGGLKIVMPFSCNSWHNLYMSAVAKAKWPIDRDGKGGANQVRFFV